jgi:hypothetical protein
MSYQTLFYEVSVGKEELLDLFLGQGSLLITKDGQTTTVQEIGDRHLQYEEDEVELHNIKILGISDQKGVGYVDGKGTLKHFKNNSEVYILDLELHLQDNYD